MRTWASGASSDTLTYSYTNNNQLTGVTHTNGSFSNESFTWDSNGNETGTGYTTGTDNEQTASPGYTYTYDNAGEMTSETQTSTGDVWTYGYDFRGRMVTAVEKTSGGTTLESVTYTYDALDNRIGMDENGTQTWTLYDRRHADHGLQRLRLFDNAVSVGTDRDRRPADLGRHGFMVPGRSPRHGPRPDQQLRRDHRSRGFQRVRDGARRDAARRAATG